MRTTGDVYLWPAAAERKLRMAYQAGLPAYLYGVTGVGKTSLIRHFLEKKEYFYVSALNTTPNDLKSEKITAPVIVLETAQPAKFEETIREALNVEPVRPAELAGIEKLPQHVVVMAPDVAAIKQFVVANV